MTSRKSLIDFRVHALRTGSNEGGRTDFHRMLSALVGVANPTATDIRPDPGDWGIDVFVGSLIDRISIWQSKYFYDAIGDSQKQQIRKSFASAMKNAQTHGYEVEAWTLCVACEMSAPERQWWDRKVREWQKDYPKLSIELWDATRIRRLLMAPEAADVAKEFYPDNVATEDDSASLLPPPVSLDDPPSYDGALFVRQLEVAGIHELDGQRRAFFNADLLVRDVSDRAVAVQLAAVNEIDTTLLGRWEDAVADPATAPDAADYEASARRLFSSVMDKTQAFTAPPELPVRPVHVRGMMHRIVEDARAGWVHDWRSIAATHMNGLSMNSANLAVANNQTQSLPEGQDE